MAKLTLQQTLDKSLKTAKQYVDTELAKKVGTKRSINFVSDHTSNWTSSSAMSGKEYLGGWHGTVPNSGTSGYLSFGASGSSTLDMFIDGDYYAKENKKVYHEGNKPTPADIGASASGHTHNYLPLSGGSLTGQVFMSQSSGDTYYYTRRSDTGTGVKFGVGSGGVNHGVYSEVLDKWMLYADASNVYLNGNATTANKVNNNLVVKLNGGSTEGTDLFTFNGSAAKTINITPSSIGAAVLLDKNVTDGFKSAFRTQITGSSANSSFISLIKSTTSIDGAPAWSTGFAWGKGDTQGYIMPKYTSSAPAVIVGGGSGDSVWSKTLAFTDHTHTVTDVTDLRLKNVDTITTIAAPVATWASSDIKSNSIIMGGDYGGYSTDDANIVFSSSKGKIHMVIDGEFYATEGKNRVYHAGNPQPTINGLSFWTGTQAAYNALSSKSSTTVYLITG